MISGRPVIAVIDDEEAVRTALRRLLASVGLAAETFGRGADFLAALAQSPPDCAVLDLHMPEMSGLEVLQRLAAMPAHPPVIAITGRDSAEAEERALGAGASVYLRKPIHQKPLLAAIARCTGIDHPSFRCVLSPDQRDPIPPENTKTKP